MGAPRFRVYAWCGGNGYGQLTISPNEVVFEPGRVTQVLLSVSGRLVHRSRRLVMGGGLLGSGHMFCLEADTPVDRLIVRRLFSSDRQCVFVNVTPLAPWTSRRIRRDLSEAGYELVSVRRWFAPVWRPLRVGK